MLGLSYLSYLSHLLSLSSLINRRFRHLLSHNAQRQRIVADILEFLVIIFTLSATCAAVIYQFLTTSNACSSGEDDITDDSPQTCGISHDGRNALLKLNLILPLLATVFRGISASLNPLAKWGVLKVGAIRAEGEIYMYRTKVGKYNPRKLNATATTESKGSKESTKKDKDMAPDVMSNASGNPRKIFSTALDAIWADLAASDISKGSLSSPPEESDPLEEVNWRISSNKRHLGLLKSTLTLPKALKQQYKKVKANLVGNSSRTIDDHLASPDLGKSKGKNKSSRSDGNDLKNDMFKDISNPIARSDSKESELDERSETKSHAGSSYGGEGSYKGSQFGDKDEHIPDMEEAKPVEQEEQELYDDGLSTITADEYVKIRLQPIISTFTRKTPALSQLTNTVTCIVIALSVCSSVFSTFSLTIFIPMALAFAGACTAWRSYKQGQFSSLLALICLIFLNYE